MPFDQNEQWYDEDEYGNKTYSDPYQYADYVNQDGSWHHYDRETGQQTTGAPGTTPPFAPATTPVNKTYFGGATDPSTGQYHPGAETSTDMAKATQQIIDTYKKEFGREPTSAELQTDLWNAFRYGTDKNLLKDIAYRAHNIAGQGGDRQAPGFKGWNYGTTGPGGTPGPGGGGGGTGPGGLPTPERMTMPTPTPPVPYGSTYQSQMADWGGGYGQEDRNRIMSAILQQPETMGPTQQAQLFEQQKELLNQQRTQQEAQLGQSLAARGLSGVGGTALAGQIMAGQDFQTQLLQSQRDIAVKAAQQNRADQLAAIEMQNAMAQGDYTRMMQVYQANQQERANTENFLRQAAELTQQGQLQINAQQLAAAVAQQREMMDFYQFLENQRQVQNDLAYRYFAAALPR